MGWIRQPCAEREQVALNPFEHRPQALVCDRRPNKSKPGVQLVDIAVGANARVALRDPRTVEQAGVATIAGPGVDFHVLIIRWISLDIQGNRAESRRRMAIHTRKRTRKKTLGLPTPVGRQWFRRRLLDWYRR